MYIYVYLYKSTSLVSYTVRLQLYLTNRNFVTIYVKTKLEVIYISINIPVLK